VTASAALRINTALAKAIAPRKTLTVSEWAENERVMSSKTSPIAGKWRNENNPLLREPMDCLSIRSSVQDMVIKFCIQIGKTEIEVNALGYSICENPGPIMVVLPDEISLNKWVQQKLNPMIEGTEAVQAAMTSTVSRNAANQSAFKDFAGGQLYVEHGKTATRMAMTSVKIMLVDEFDKFAAALTSGEDPDKLIEGRLSAFPQTYKRVDVGSPGLKGISRIDQKWEKSDQRKYYVPCPHCGVAQPLEWSGLHWSPGGVDVFYACRENGCRIDEHHKRDMIANGRWVAENPGARIRGYTTNCLYYDFRMGPRWATLVEMWLDAQNDPAKLQVFVQERLAEAWEDPAMRNVKHNVIADRAEAYRLRSAPLPVLAVTAGVDTQDDRLEVQILGWDRRLASWTLDYVVLPGDPQNEEVWVALVELLNKPIEHASGNLLRVEALAIDAAGHRTQAVYNFVRLRKLRRCIPTFGAVPNNAPVLSRGKLQDTGRRAIGKLDRSGITTHHVGTVGIKHMLYARISADSDKAPDARLVHISDELPPQYFTGLVSETYDPRKNRFVKRNGVRNEPLDTWVLAYAATHHPELRLHRLSRAEWDARQQRLGAVPEAPAEAPPISTANIQRTKVENVPHETISPAPNGFASDDWLRRR
jgi:phage terminase large subunit GpA-like protein